MELLDTNEFGLFDAANNYIQRSAIPLEQGIDVATEGEGIEEGQSIYRLYKWWPENKKIDEPDHDMPHNMTMVWDTENPAIDTDRGVAIYPHTLRLKTDESLLEANTTTFAELRTRRSELLAESDIVVIKAAEAGTTISDEWKAYRQALRDLPSDSGAPFNATWPTKPE